MNIIADPEPAVNVEITDQDLADLLDHLAGTVGPQAALHAYGYLDRLLRRQQIEAIHGVAA